MSWYIDIQIFDYYFLKRLTLSDIPISVQYQAMNLLKTTRYEEMFARQIFDYSFAACMAEARHAYDKCYDHVCLDIPYSTEDSRSVVLENAYQYNPKECLPVLIELFYDYEWSDGYGGESWGKIAETAYKYLTGELTDAMYIDASVYLAHNNGIYFDKGYIFAFHFRDSLLEDFLEFKRHKDILRDLDYWERWIGDDILLSTPVYNLVTRVIDKNRIIKEYTRHYTILNGNIYEPVEYGTETVAIVEWEDDWGEEEEDEECYLVEVEGIE